jgi:IS30 family transposase
MRRIRDRTAPEKIAREVKKRFCGVKISRSTIYRRLKRHRPEMMKFLPFEGKERRQRVTSRRNQFQEAAAPKRSIWERALGAFDHSEYGHWEGDTIHSGKDGAGAVLSLRELKSRLGIFIPIDDLSAETTRKALEAFFETLPAHLKRTLTVDRGSEFAEHREFELSGKGLPVYFCDAYCSWQKGSVENSNRGFRKHFPKKTDFSKVPPEQIQSIQLLLNRELMECLNWANSEDVFGYALKLAA